MLNYQMVQLKVFHYSNCHKNEAIMSIEDEVRVMHNIAVALRDTNCYLMVFDKTFQITDCDTEESHDFKSPEDALQYMENKREYMHKQFLLINKKST